MALLSQVFKAKEKIFSFEVFPAKTSESHAKLLETIKQLCALRPDFISCTYGAGGGSRDKTFEIVDHIQTSHQIPSMAHLTCVSHTRPEIKDILDEFERRNITNILALRGDPSKAEEGSAMRGDFAVRQCRELLDAGAPSIHFYTLNKIRPIDKILQAIRHSL